MLASQLPEALNLCTTNGVIVKSILPGAKGHYNIVVLDCCIVYSNGEYSRVMQEEMFSTMQALQQYISDIR